MEQRSEHIAVIGAGIVGMSCALWLQEKGFRVSVIDGNAPGSMTSYGNACTIADYGCVPVNNPALPKQLPTLLFGKNNPLSVNPLYAVTHLPWLIRFLLFCRKSEVAKIVSSLGKILAATNEGLDPLIRMSGSDDLLREAGCLYLYQSRKNFEQARKSNQSRAENGVTFTEINSRDIKDLEPNLKMAFPHGLLFKNARQVLNPLSLVERYFDTFTARRGKYHHQHATSICADRNRVKISMTDDRTVSVERAVICSGAFSGQIPGAGVEKLPLDTERGYHIQFKDRQTLLTRPVGWAEAGFYATPMNHGLRFAGTVEIAGLTRKKNQRNLNYLKRKAKQMFELPEEPQSDWLGYRPTMPDALPVIGPSEKSHRILYAFGHQHIGLTLAGITGKLISEIAAMETPSIDISAFRAGRFR